MMAAIGPEMQKFLWWKKYLTILQMIQFVGIMVHAFQLIFHNPCNYPMAFVYWIGAHAVMFFFLFKSFYKVAYKNHGKKSAVKAVQEDLNKNGTVVPNANTTVLKNTYLTNGYPYHNDNVRNRIVTTGNSAP
jgi:hypothetical protein